MKVPPATKNVAFGSNGECLILDRTIEQACFYQFTGSKYDLVWKKPHPVNIPGSIEVEISGSFIVMREHDYDKSLKTYVFDKDLEQVKVFAPTKGESLADIGENDDLYYSLIEDGLESTVVRSIKNHEILRTFEQPFQGSSDPDDNRNICIHPTTGDVAVTVTDVMWLDIYDKKGNRYLF